MSRHCIPGRCIDQAFVEENGLHQLTLSLWSFWEYTIKKYKMAARVSVLWYEASLGVLSVFHRVYICDRPMHCIVHCISKILWNIIWDDQVASSADNTSFCPLGSLWHPLGRAGALGLHQYMYILLGHSLPQSLFWSRQKA